MNLEDLNVEKKLKIVYMGTPEFSAVVLKGLLEQYDIIHFGSSAQMTAGKGKTI